MVMANRELKVGTRVRLRAPSHALEVPTEASRVGTVIGPAEWDGYYLIRLDAPVIYHYGDGRTKETCDIREDVENLEILPTA